MSLTRETKVAILSSAAVSAVLGALLGLQVGKTIRLEKRVKALETEVHATSQAYTNALDFGAKATAAINRSVEPILKERMDQFVKAGKTEDAKRVAGIALANNDIARAARMKPGDNPALFLPRN